MIEKWRKREKAYEVERKMFLYVYNALMNTRLQVITHA